MSSTSSGSARRIDSTNPLDIGGISVSIKGNHAKICSSCGTYKTEDHFRRVGFTGALSSMCKACEAQKRRRTVAQKQAEAKAKELSVELNGRKLTQVTRATDSRGITDERFRGVKSCELLAELEARGYKWDNMWLEKVEVYKLKVVR